MLGTAVGDSESFQFWREFLGLAEARGLAGVHLVISDAHAGLKAAVAQQFTNSPWQRCRVHFMRILHTAVSAKHTPAVTAAVKTIFAHTDPGEVAAQWDRVAETLASSFAKVAAMMADAKTDVLAFTAFPESALAEDLAGRPHIRSLEQEDQASRRRGGDLSQPRSVSYDWRPRWSSTPTMSGR